MPDGQTQEEGIGELVMSHEASAKLAVKTGQSVFQGVDAMRGAGRHLGQSLHDVSEEDGHLQDGRLPGEQALAPPIRDPTAWITQHDGFSELLEDSAGGGEFRGR
jgi:hypothetical protein